MANKQRRRVGVAESEAHMGYSPKYSLAELQVRAHMNAIEAERLSGKPSSHREFRSDSSRIALSRLLAMDRALAAPRAKKKLGK